MIVLDASALVALLVGEPAVTDAIAAIGEADGRWVVPEHTVIEVTSALRGLALGRQIERDELSDLVQELIDLDLDVWPTAPLLPRVVELVDNASAYDAAYLALAEELSTTLVTLDQRLSTVPGIRCAVRIPDGSTSRP